MENFFDYYDSLGRTEKKNFRKEIIKLCAIEPPTWYSWFRRKTVGKQSQKLISQKLGIPVSALFPEETPEPVN